MCQCELTFSDVLGHWEASVMVPGGPEQVPGWPMRPMGGAGQPTSDLDIRFPIFVGHMVLRAYVF